jgi:2-polyprenyl-3-methyl-5-hydroxy-6-metoxy-1,4-benzoquinol methylase
MVRAQRDATGLSCLLLTVDRAFALDANEAHHPIGAALAGAVRVLGQELRIPQCAFIDTAGAIDGIAVPVERSGTFAWRPGQLSELLPEPLHQQPFRPTALRSGGTYLITGGTGAIGRVLAAAVLERPNTRVVLLGRTATPESVSELLVGYQGRLLLAQADVSFPNQLRAALTSLGLEPADISGVFHLAASAADILPIEFASANAIVESASAKCAGVRSLAALFEDHPLEFVVCFSSTASSIGGPGLYAYAAASAYLDGYCQLQAAKGRCWVSLDWDWWAVGDFSRIRLRALNNHFFNRDEALKLLMRLLVPGLAGQIVCMKGDYASRVETAAPRSRATAAASAPEQPAEGLAGELCKLWSDVIGGVVGPDDDFFELGGDSLAAARLASAIHERWGVRIRLPEFLAAATPHKLTHLVRSRRAAASEEEGVRQVHATAIIPQVKLAHLTPSLNRLAYVFMERAQRRVGKAQVHLRHRRLLSLCHSTVRTRAREIQGWREEALDNDLQDAAAVANRLASGTVYKIIVEGVLRIGRLFPEILAGEEDALLEVMRGGEMSLAEVAYRKMPEAIATLSEMSEFARSFLAQRTGTISVLEVGGGFGVATERILPLLPNDAEFIFTDLSETFFRDIKRRAPQVKCRILDLNERTQLEALAREHQFDLILASNALHCAQSIRDTLGAFVALLKPGGALLLSEAVQNEPWHLVALGALTGFLDYTDERSRGIGPFLSVKEWKELMDECGFACSIVDEEAVAQRGQTTMLCTLKQQERAN